MLTKNEIKYLRSLHQKKGREEALCFICEGEKLVEEAVNSNYQVKEVLTRTEIDYTGFERVRKISTVEMERISGMSTAPGILALVEYPVQEPPQINSMKDRLFLILDGINDPGNLGTIIRIADWFGIKHIFCSENTADRFNQKTVQASMGSIFRVEVHYADLNELSDELNAAGIPVFAAVMNGKNIAPGFCPAGALVLGSESHGITNEKLLLSAQKITIPAVGKAESLNVAVAAGIVCAFARL